MKKFNIALDGPSGAGKSTLADRLAAHYGMVHLDTGAMYRAVSWYLNQQNIPADREDAVKKALESVSLDMEPDGAVIINGTDVTKTIRQPEVSLMASTYASIPAVRTKMVELQQKIAAKKGYILDGRDICEVVLPDAEVKMYLDASPEARARRRTLQDQEAGKDVNYEQVLKEIEKRDYQDSHREVSPLKVSKDATVVDSSDLTLEQTEQKMIEICEKALLKEGLV